MLLLAAVCISTAMPGQANAAGTFPAGGVMPAGWVQSSGSNQSWVVDLANASEGTSSLRSGTITHNQTSAIEVTTATGVGNITFDFMIDSESGYDRLIFYIDGVEQTTFAWSGSIPWGNASFAVSTASVHTFKWAYVKDGSVNSGADAAWIDNVVFPSAGAGTTNDFSNDGKSDILWQNTATGLNYLYMMNGTTIASEGVIDVLADSNWQVVGTGDYDGNGTADILWRHAVLGLNKIYFMDGNTIVSQGNILTIADTNWRVVGDGDYNDDGKADILWRHAVTGQNVIYLMDGLNVTNAQTLNRVSDTDWQVVGDGDYNGDGRSDILWRHAVTGRNHIYLIDVGGLTVASQGTINSVPLNWEIVGGGDYDGDGKNDILWRNTLNGRVHMYLMNGFAIASQGTVRSVPLNWEIVGDGDYDGDGKADILWRNMTNGRNYMYFMNGPTIIGGGVVNTVSNFDWVIVQPEYTAPLPGVTVTPTSGLTTTETGGFDTFSVFLNTQPSANVSIGVSSSDTGEGTVSTGMLTFTPANWNSPQIVTVTGVDDAVDDGDATYSAILSPATSTDTDYVGLNPADASLININDGGGTMVGGIDDMKNGNVPGAEGTFQSILNADAGNLEAAIGLCMVDAANLWDDPNLQAILPNLTTDGGATLPTQAQIAADMVGGQPNHYDMTNWATRLPQVAVNATVLQDPAFDTTHAKLSHCIGLFEGVKASGFAGQSMMISGSDVNWDVADINAMLAHMYGARGSIDWSRAYDWATDVDGDGITDTDTATFIDASGSYQYRTIATDPAAVLNDPTFFTLQVDGVAKLANALADFRQATSMQEQFLTAMDPVAHPGRATDHTHAMYYASAFEWNWQQNLATDLQEIMDVGTALSPAGFSDVVTHLDGTTSPGTIFAGNAFTTPLTSAAFPSFGYKVPRDPVLSKKHNKAVADLFASGLPVTLEPIMRQDYGDSSMAGVMTGAFDLALYDERRLPTSSMILRDASGAAASFGFGSMAVEGLSAYIVEGFGSVSVRQVNLGTGIVGSNVSLANPAIGEVSPWSGVSVVAGNLRLLINGWDPVTFQQKFGIAVNDPTTGSNVNMIEWNLPPNAYAISYMSDGVYDYVAAFDWTTGTSGIYRAPVSPAALPVTPVLFAPITDQYNLRLIGGDGTYLYAFGWSTAMRGFVLYRIDASGVFSAATFFDEQLDDPGFGRSPTLVGGNVYSLDSPILDVTPLPPTGDFR